MITCPECLHEIQNRAGMHLDSHVHIELADELAKGERCAEHQPSAQRWFKLMRDVVATAGKDTI